MHPMEQTTFRLPQSLARRLGSYAKARGVTKSVVVREALERYLVADHLPTGTMMVAEPRSAGYLGSLSLDRQAETGDRFAAMIRERNWRE